MLMEHWRWTLEHLTLIVKPLSTIWKLNSYEKKKYKKINWRSIKFLSLESNVFSSVVAFEDMLFDAQSAERDNNSSYFR